MSLFRISVLLSFAAMTAAILDAKPKKPPKSFVPPPAPASQPETRIEDPLPALPGAQQSNGVAVAPARLLPGQQPLEPEMRMGLAQRHYERGAAFQEDGDMAAARIEFDQALELLTSTPQSMPGRGLIVRRYQQLVEEIYRIESSSTEENEKESGPIFDPSPIEEIAGMTFPIEPGLKDRLQAQVQATASQLPLELADPVVSLIQYFSSPRGRAILTSGFVRMGRYAPMVRRILDEEGLPPELIFMAQAESGFLPRAASNKQAMGMWQFVQFRGREYGLKQTPHTDDRLDPEMATRSAARHLRDLYTQFGDWHLAIAGYNCGPVAVERAVQRTGYADFWELYKRSVLPRETANYVPIILAMTIMAKNATDYGLTQVTQDEPLEYDTITMAADSHLALIADIADQPLSAIKDLNPAVLRLTAPAGYAVHVPKGLGKRVLAALESIPAAKRLTWRLHRVNPGDTTATIARQYRLSEKAVVESNLTATLDPKPGDLIVIPAAYPGAKPTVKKRTTRARRSTSSKSRTSTAKKTPPSRRSTSRRASPSKSKTPVSSTGGTARKQIARK
ncbi:MAG: transglycosylase SLT domain-containing protein [Bryobacteraceae bacterium]